MTQYELHHGDCLEVLRTLPDNSVDSIVTDPPAGIAFMGKDWDRDKGGRTAWVAWMSEVAAECLRVVKPGGHALVWAIPRTSHWTGWAWEDAGWEVRDKAYHVFGSGFPKSLDVSKALDKAAGAAREVVGVNPNSRPNMVRVPAAVLSPRVDAPITAPATVAAREWDGWGTALKPAVEEWWLLRKPLSERTVAANVLRWGTGALNIDACRVGTESTIRYSTATGMFVGKRNDGNVNGSTSGRFPAHLTHDGSAAAVGLFPDDNARFFAALPADDEDIEAALVLYCAKASKRDRDEGLEGFDKRVVNVTEGHGRGVVNTSKSGDGIRENRPRANIHPTVKPTALMRWLARLVTPRGGVVLDPFTGSGSTGKAAMLEGFRFVGIEQNAEYLAIARARIEHAANQAQQLTLDTTPLDVLP